MKNSGLSKAIDKAGSQSELARALGVYQQLVHQWTVNGVPPKWVLSIEKATGIPRHELRPDIYPPV